MAIKHGLGTYGDGAGTVTPEAHKLAQAGLIVKRTTGAIRPGLFWEGNSTIVSGKSGMSYDVAAFVAATTRGATSGAVLLANDGVVNVATTAAPGSNSRIDVVYVWQREFSLDGTDSNPVIGVVQGTAAASPTVPSLAAFPGAIELARITVPAGVTATNSGTTITQTAPFTAAAGGVVHFRNTTARDAETSLPAGALSEVDENLYSFDGSTWKTLSNPFVSLAKTANQTLTTGSTEYAVTWDVELSDIEGMHDSGNPSRVTVPLTGVYEVTMAFYIGSNTGVGTVFARKNGTTAINGSAERRAGASGVGTPLSRTFPVSLSASDYIEIMASCTSAGPALAGGASEFASAISVKFLGA